MMDENTRIYLPSTRPTSVVAVVQSHQNLLIIQRLCGPNIGQWMLPERIVTNYETLKRAAGCAVDEVAGITVTCRRFIGFFDNPCRNAEHSVAAAFSLKPIGMQDGVNPTLRDGKESRAIWCKICDLPPLGCDHTKIVSRYLTLGA